MTISFSLVGEPFGLLSFHIYHVEAMNRNIDASALHADANKIRSLAKISFKQIFV